MTNKNRTIIIAVSLAVVAAAASLGVFLLWKPEPKGIVVFFASQSPNDFQQKFFNFQELLEFLEEAELDRVGCFAYSPVEGATANALPDAVPAELREERRARFMAVQEKISRKRLKRKIGKTLKVLVDAVDNKGAVARSAADAPEIDGVVNITDGKKLKPGDWATVKIERADAHDLWGRIIA